MTESKGKEIMTHYGSFYGVISLENRFCNLFYGECFGKYLNKSLPLARGNRLPN